MIVIPTQLEALEALLLALEPEAIATFLPNRGPERSSTLGALEEAVNQHHPRLSDEALVRLAAIGLRSLADDHPFVLVCAEELIRRGSEEGQLGFVNVVIEAREQYDPGHRPFAGTVLDRLVDDVLPRFALDPLATLLRGLDFDVLGGPDGFAALFGAAFAKVEGELPRALLSAVRGYVEGCQRHGGDLQEAMTLLGEAAQKSPDPAGLAATIAELREDLALQASLETDDLEVARALLERVGRDLSFHRAVKFHNSLRPLQTFATQLPYELVEGVFVRAWNTEREPRYPETNLGRTLWPLFVNDPARAQRFCLAFAERCDDRKLFLKVVEWAIRDADRQSPAGEEVAKDTLALLNGLDPAKERAEAALKERRSSLSSQISWAFMQDDVDEALELMKDPENRALINAELLEEIIGHLPLTAALKAGDATNARALAEAGLALLVFQREHPDPAPEPRPGQRQSSAERRRAKAGGLPSSLSVIEFVANALVVATPEAQAGTPFTRQLLELATSLAALDPGGVPYATLPFNLACVHAKRGERSEVLVNVRRAAALGQKKASFLTDEDLAAYREDPEFLEAIEAKAEGA